MIDRLKPYKKDKRENPVISSFDYDEGAVYTSAGIIFTFTDLTKFAMIMD